MKKLLASRKGFFALAVIFLWAKTYFSYKKEFNLDITNAMQEFLLVINPLSASIVFLGLAFLAKGRRMGIWLLVIDFIMSFLLYANVLYYRFFNDFITLPTLKQTDNLSSGMGGSIFGLMEGYDFIYFLDIILLIVLYIFTRKNWNIERLAFRKTAMVIISGVALFAVNLGLAEVDRPQLLQRTFDRTYLVKYLGPYNYTIYDAVQNAKTSTQRVMASPSDLSEVTEFTKENYAEPNEKYFGNAEGMNVIKIHLESFQSFLINYKLNGEEVTPFLNSLVNDKQITYFDNFFHQTEQGKTADAELLMDNSLYGLPQGSAFSVKGTNTYQAAPAILNQEQGYTSAVFHGDEKTFWNRDEIYKQFGVDHFFDSTYYNMENSVNYGLKDKPFFEESMPLLESLDQPFYAHMITLTNHYPFTLDQEDATIDKATTGDSTVDNYFQTARYLDEALEQFFNDLKESGLYDNSVILLYGDHYGISTNHNRAMEEITGKEMTDYQNAQMQRVPLMIKAPGLEGGVNHTYGGELDVLPTLEHLLGIDSSKYIQFGTDLLSEEHNDVVGLRNGDFISKDYTVLGDTYYDTDTGEVIDDEAQIEEIKKEKEELAKKLSLNDKILYGDLLRFYDPEGWTPVDPSDYNYNNRSESEEK